MNFSDDILWVFSSKAFLPSDIIGGIYPATYLNIKRLIFLSNHDAIKTLDNLKPKLIILGKCLNSNIINLVNEAKKREIKVISIFDDWHFEPITEREKIKFDFNFKLSELSDNIVVKSYEAQKLIKKNLNIDSKIINDSIRYKTLEIKHRIEKKPNLLWFGTSSNYDTLIFSIDEISSQNIDCNLSIVTNVTDELKIMIQKSNLKNINIKFVDFSDKKLTEEALISDIILIPQFSDNRRAVKSSNRFVDAINFGRLVITNKDNLHVDLKKYYFKGLLTDGIDWAKKNPEKLLFMLESGQKYVRNEYSIDAISMTWMKLIQNTI